LIAERNLPDHRRPAARGGERGHVFLPSVEVREGDVQAVPPPILSVDALVVASGARRIIQLSASRAGRAQPGSGDYEQPLVLPQLEQT